MPRFLEQSQDTLFLGRSKATNVGWKFLWGSAKLRGHRQAHLGLEAEGRSLRGPSRPRQAEGPNPAPCSVTEGTGLCFVSPSFLFKKMGVHSFHHHSSSIS